MTLQVGVTAVPPAGIQWYHNDVLLPGATEPRLQLAFLRATHEGLYYALACNAVDCRESQTSSVRLLQPPVLVRQPANATVLPNTAAIFTADITGTPYPQMQWFFNGEPMQDETHTSLILSAVREQDEGTYTLQASNALGQIRSQPAHLRVLDPPRLLDAPRPTQVFQGSSASLAVQASGDAPLAYSWMVRTCHQKLLHPHFPAARCACAKTIMWNLHMQRNGKRLGNATGSGPILVLANVSQSDAGLYTVLVTNPAGA